MNELLTNQGWAMYYSCLCGGGKKYYNHPDKAGYEVRIKERSNTFSIVKDNNIISGPHWGYMLQENLNLYIA